ncbi:hypothetical protein [Parabacteroides distasonis]|uniref:hypothetical protein n=1 Tax=Parabacteroides distasonis TaxID=823 RepID=UPI0018AAB11D|nr:hypothetical protein [Parabacteroides distasonis]
MRHKLLYLLALALTATSSGWGQDVDTLVYSSGGKLCKMILPQTPSNSALESIPSCFANGNPVRVYLNQASGRMIVETIETDGGTPDTLQFEPGKFGVFGGSLGKAVTSASITLESGSIRSIFGGGMFVGNAGTGKTTQAVTDKYSYKNSDGSYYTPVSADVSDAVSIEIKPGAVVSNLLLGGGRYYAKTNTVNIKADQATIMAIYAGGYDQGQTTNTLTTDVDASVNGVKNVNMTLSKCTIPEGLGTGGGQGYTHTGTSVVTVTDSELGAIYGTLSNGYADDITVNMTNTTFKKQYNGSDIQYRELASINRGGVKNISFTFDGCSFEEPESIVAGLGAVDGWADSDTNGKPQPIVNGNVSYKFINSKTETPTFSVGRGLDNANIELTGAKASLRHFVDGKKIPEGLSEFTLSADKTWTFNDGLVIDTAVTFTNNGTLVSAITAVRQPKGTSYDVYANGTPIEITAYSTDSVKITKQGKTAVAFKVPSTSKIYGGAKESTVASTSINMISGTVRTMLGGGNSTKSDTPADVTGKISIQIQKDATVSYLLVGGGYRYSKANEVYIDIQGGTVSQLYPGGDDGGKTTNTIDTPLDQSVNGVKTVTINMNSGVIAGGIGCGGGNGYTHTGVSTVTIQNATIAAFYGTLSNGRADEITATVTGCTFPTSINGTAIKDREFATINRGAVGTASFKFDGCTFEEPGNMNASLGAIMGWADSDTNGRPAPAVDGTVSFEFINSKTATPLMVFSRGLHQANINLSGAKASLVSFRDGTAVPGTLSEFALGEGKTWNLDGGFSVAEGVTFTKQGILNATALDASDLLALASVHADKIALVEGTYELPSQLTITKPMVLNGAGMDKTVIKAGTADWAHTYNADLNMISIENATDITPVEGGEVVISNLTASNAKRNGLNVQTSMAVKLDSVTLKDNTAAGLVVHSKVDATDMHTSGNAWGGVNIDKGTPEYSTLCFTFDANSTFAEKAPIYSELYDQEKIVVVPDDSWERLVQMSAESKGVAMWLKRLIVTAGQTLTADVTYANRNVYIENTGTLNVTAPLALAKVTMEEGARLVPTSPATTTDKITATTLQLNTPLKDSEWKAFGFPSTYKVQSTTEPATEYTQPTVDPKADTGAWYATLKGTSSPEFEYKTDEFGQAGLLSATTGEYAIVSTAADPIELKAATEPDAPTTATFTIFANTGTDELTLTKNQYVYKLNAASNEFVQCTEKTLKPFESVIFTDASTYSTLRSLRLGDNIVTGTQEIEPVEGYYVTTDRGAIMIHTAEPVQVLIVEMSGRIAYKGIATDGQRIMVPAGIYAVNGQLVRVK